LPGSEEIRVKAVTAEVMQVVRVQGFQGGGSSRGCQR
jgi:hypothetical protein